MVYFTGIRFFNLIWLITNNIKPILKVSHTQEDVEGYHLYKSFAISHLSAILVAQLKRRWESVKAARNQEVYGVMLQFAPVRFGAERPLRLLGRVSPLQMNQKQTFVLFPELHDRKSISNGRKEV